MSSMAPLTEKDFEKVDISNNLWYLVYKFKDGTKRSICLEPCLSGFCVGIYDGEEELLADKVCTLIPNHIHEFGRFFLPQLTRSTVVNMALRIANDFIKNS